MSGILTAQLGVNTDRRTNYAELQVGNEADVQDAGLAVYVQAGEAIPANSTTIRISSSFIATPTGGVYSCGVAFASGEWGWVIKSDGGDALIQGHRPLAALCGDSLSALSGIDQIRFQHSWWSWFSYFTRGYFDLRIDATKGGWKTGNFILSGEEDGDGATAGDGLTEVLASDAEWAFLLIGINDVGVYADATTTIANLTTIVEAFRDKGMKLVLISPYGSTGTPNSADEQTHYNAMINHYQWMSRKYPGVIYTDMSRAFVDLSGTYTDPIIPYTHDGVHPSNAGAIRIGWEVSKAVLPHIGYERARYPYFSTDSFDGLNAIEAAGLNTFWTGQTSGYKAGLGTVNGTVQNPWTVAANADASGVIDVRYTPRRVDYALWAATTAYSLGDIVRPAAAAGWQTGAVVAICDGAGTSGSSEPNFDGNYGNSTVADNTATWKVVGLPLVWQASTVFAVGSVVRPTTFDKNYSDVLYMCTAQTGATDASEPTWVPKIGEATSETNVTWRAITGVDGVPGYWVNFDKTSGNTGDLSGEEASYYTGNIDLPAGIVAGDTVEIALELAIDRVEGMNNPYANVQWKNSGGTTVSDVAFVTLSSTYGRAGFDLNNTDLVLLSHRMLIPATATKFRLFCRFYAVKFLIRWGRFDLRKVQE